MAWVVDYFTSATGQSPFRRWRRGLTALQVAAVDAKIDSEVRPDGPGAASCTDHGDGLLSIPVHFRQVRLRVFYAADPATSTVWLLHGYDVAADPASERATREAAETEAARRILERAQQQRSAR